MACLVLLSHRRLSYGKKRVSGAHLGGEGRIHPLPSKRKVSFNWPFAPKMHHKGLKWFKWLKWIYIPCSTLIFDAPWHQLQIFICSLQYQEIDTCIFDFDCRCIYKPYINYHLDGFNDIIIAKCESVATSCKANNV